MSKYDEMKNMYEVHINLLRARAEEADRWRDHYFELAPEVASLKSKVEVYEKVLSKFLGDREKNTDEVVMFDGKTYVVNGFTLEHNQEGPDTLTVNCTRMGILG